MTRDELKEIKDIIEKPLKAKQDRLNFLFHSAAMAKDTESCKALLSAFNYCPRVCEDYYKVFTIKNENLMCNFFYLYIEKNEIKTKDNKELPRINISPFKIYNCFWYGCDHVCRYK